jgi:methyl-accepting chemotaxis protein
MLNVNILKLRNRILGGYSVPILLSLLVTGAVFVTVQSAKNASKLAEAAHEIVDDGQDMAFAISNMQKYARGHIIAKSATSESQYKESKAEFIKLNEELKQEVKDEQQKANLDKIAALGEQIDAYNTKLIALVNQGKASEAAAIWAKGEGREFAAQLEEEIVKFKEREQEILDERINAEDAALNSLIAVVVGGAILSTAASITLGILIASAIVKLLEKTANEIASSSTEIAATVEQQERTMAQQASSVNETTTTMEELGASSRQAAEQAESSTSGAREALAIAENGSRAVEQTMEGMSVLKEQVRAIAEQIMSLSEQTGQISSISDLVADIANQTNMLALNAAVEAARAGEQGKGFSVVASEIRKLADESKKSAQKIGNLVQDLQASMNSTVMVTDEGTKKTDESIKLAQGTAQAFMGVTEAVNNVFVNSQQISLSAKQQAVAVQQVLSAMNAINLGSRETVAGITQVKVSTQQLNDAAQQLQVLV